MIHLNLPYHVMDEKRGYVVVYRIVRRQRGTPAESYFVEFQDGPGTRWQKFRGPFTHRKSAEMIVQSR